MMMSQHMKYSDSVRTYNFGGVHGLEGSLPDLAAYLENVTEAVQNLDNAQTEDRPGFVVFSSKGTVVAVKVQP